MVFDVKIPSVGESVTEALLAEWFKADGDRVEKDEALFIIETDKVSLEVVAEAAGVLRIRVVQGETVPIGTVVASIEADAADGEVPVATVKPVAAPVSLPAESARVGRKAGASAQSPLPAPEPATLETDGSVVLSPSVRRLVAEQGIDVAAIAGTGPGGRITKADVLLFLESAARPAAAKGPVPQLAPKAAIAPPAPSAIPPLDDSGGISRKPMSPLRRRIADRLLAAKQETAMLTTFNEIDMSRTMAIRAAYKDAFAKRHGVSLGFMSFFTKACVAALQEIPEINAFIDGDDLVFHHAQHIGIAVGSERGLVVPVIRNAQDLSFAEIEQAIIDAVDKINHNRLDLADLTGGTFTISNGGVYGSLLSTPILNPPQSAILGMHKIEKRPVVVDDAIVIRPMMYVALSYDHRVVDGKGAVTFLKRIKEFIENPERIMMEI